MRENTALIISGLLSFVVFFAFLRKMFKDWLVIIPASYFVGNALYNSVFNYSIMIRKNAQAWLVETFICIMFISVIFTFKNFESRFKNIYESLLFLVTLSSSYYLFSTHGLIDASSFESAQLIFIATMPLLYMRSISASLRALFLTGLGLYIGGSTGLAMVVLCAIEQLYYTKVLKWIFYPLMIVAAIYAYKYTYVFNDSNRLYMWGAYLKHWQEHYNMIVGSGIGSFQNISPRIPIYEATYLYAHNDILQTYLETGLIGLVMFCALITRLLEIAWKARCMAAALSMLVFMVNYFPLQILLTKMIFILCISAIFMRAKAKEIC